MTPRSERTPASDATDTSLVSPGSGISATGLPPLILTALLATPGGAPRSARAYLVATAVISTVAALRRRPPTELQEERT